MRPYFTYTVPLAIFLVLSMAATEPLTEVKDSELAQYSDHPVPNTTPRDPKKNKNEEIFEWDGENVRILILAPGGHVIEVGDDLLAGNDPSENVKGWAEGFTERANQINREILGDNNTAAEINDQLSGLFSSGEVCGSEAVKINKSKAMDSLEWFFARLRSFVQAGVFEYRQFEVSGEELGRQLSQISERVKTAPICNSEVLRQYSFAKQMFETMVEAIEPLRHYSTVHAPGNLLVYSMIDMNIQIMALCDNMGEPNPRADDYEAKVHRFVDYLNQWEQKFNNDPPSAFGTREAFKKQSQKATAALALLTQNIAPKPQSIRTSTSSEFETQHLVRIGFGPNQGIHQSSQHKSAN
ncbi:hypothetical protein OXX69_005166 [Metschnikowia pulcherrima]